MAFTPLNTPNQPAIEQLILSRGTRGMERLARYLPADYAAKATRALWLSHRVLITTGFYVDGHPETDGPPGAFFLGRALAAHGTTVCFVAESEVLSMLKAIEDEMPPLESGTSGTGQAVSHVHYIEFPIVDTATSRIIARDIILHQQPSAIVAIECCGRTLSGRYLNMLGIDITSHTPQVDELFAPPAEHHALVTIGIGDGGNEIGMGSIIEHIPGELGITDPVETRVDHLVAATVSNWGAYGIIAYLSQLASRDLLPGHAEEARVLEIMLAHGAIDGLTHRAEQSVDGFSTEATSALLTALRRELL